MRSPELKLIFILIFTLFIVSTAAQTLPEIILKLINDLLSMNERSGQCGHCVGDTKPAAPGILGNQYKNECFRKCNEGDLQMRTISELIQNGKSSSKKTKMKTGLQADDKMKTGLQADDKMKTVTQNQKAEIVEKRCDHCRKEEYKLVDGKDAILYANQCYKRCHEAYSSGKVRTG